MYFPNIRFYILIEDICMEGTISLIFDIGPSSYFIKSRKTVMKKL